MKKSEKQSNKTEVLNEPWVMREIIDMSKLVAKPWVIATYVISFLLLLSVVGNIYQSSRKTKVIIENDASFVSSDNNVNAIIKD